MSFALVFEVKVKATIRTLTRWKITLMLLLLNSLLLRLLSWRSTKFASLSHVSAEYFLIRRTAQPLFAQNPQMNVNAATNAISWFLYKTNIFYCHKHNKIPQCGWCTCCRSDGARRCRCRQIASLVVIVLREKVFLTLTLQKCDWLCNTW